MIKLKGSRRGRRAWLARHWRRAVAGIAIGVAVVLVAVQVFYPSDRLVPFTTVDGIVFGGELKADAEATLDDEYRQQQVSLYFKDAEEPYVRAYMNELGLLVTNEDRFDGLDYPWYLRIVPTSLLWMHLVQGATQVEYQSNAAVREEYILGNFGDPCIAPTRNATLQVKNDLLTLVEGATGGLCTTQEVTSAIEEYAPSLTNPSINLGGTAVLPAISNASARVYAEKLTHNIGAAIVLKFGEQSIPIPNSEVLNWLVFSSDAQELGYVFNEAMASEYLLANIADKVAKPAGTSVITMRNFVEESRKDGEKGRMLDVTTTLDSIKKQIDDGTPATLTTVEVAPALTYDDTFSPSDEALSAVMKNYAQSHSGSYAATLIEIGGKGRYASYRGGEQFVTASTYKLFVAYSTLLRVESGEWSWSDSIQGGRNLSRCFDDMIKLSDNACAEAFLRRIGYSTMTNEAHALGCLNTSFVNGNIRSTTEDQTRLLGLLYSGRILNDQADRDKWISAMKVNVYRQGIPKGISGAVVADKVGFLDELLHDSAIVYTSTGTYVLTIYTAYATWDDIAGLAAQLEAARTK